MAQPPQTARLWARSAVGREADCRLEGAQGRIGGGPVQAVDLARGEAELGEAPLEGHDVVALDEVPGDVAQHTVAQRPARSVEDGIRRLPDDAVDHEATALLEGLDGPLDALVEHRLAVGVGGARATGKVSGEDEPLTDGGHGRPGVAAPQHDGLGRGHVGSFWEGSRG